MCIYPRLIENKKYKSNKKNGGNIPKMIDKRVALVPIKCGRCMECKKEKARNWTVRLSEEIKKDKRGKFVTLTFDDKHLKILSGVVNEGERKLNGYNLDNAVAKLGVRRFLER